MTSSAICMEKGDDGKREDQPGQKQQSHQSDNPRHVSTPTQQGPPRFRYLRGIKDHIEVGADDADRTSRRWGRRHQQLGPVRLRRRSPVFLTVCGGSIQSIDAKAHVSRIVSCLFQSTSTTRALATTKGSLFRSATSGTLLAGRGLVFSL